MRLTNKLSSEKTIERIISCAIISCLIFVIVTTLSFYLLPEGFLRNKSEVSNFKMSNKIVLGSLQIFGWNLLSVIMIIFSSLFNKQKDIEKPDYSLGYSVFFILITLNAITLGTWSFSEAGSDAPNLFTRIAGTVDIIHRGGLWEMAGQLLITCSLAHFFVINIATRTKRKFSIVKLKKEEKIILLAGFILIYIGALVETISIIK